MTMRKKTYQNHSLDFVERNNINRLNIIFKFTNFFFKKIGSNLKEIFYQKQKKKIRDYFTLSSSTTQPICNFLTPKATGTNLAI
jgi:hypothetical protein